MKLMRSAIAGVALAIGVSVTTPSAALDPAQSVFARKAIMWSIGAHMRGIKAGMKAGDGATVAAGANAIAALAGAFLNMFLTLSEELGWRGWLWDRWRGLGFWRCNLLIGLFWGLWHAPLIAQGYNYPELPVWGPVAMTALMLVISPLIGWVREAGGTVFHAGLFHGTLNAGAGLGLLALTGLEFPFKGTLGIGGFVAGLALCGVVFAIRRRAANTAPETGQAL